jgi:cobaltochelatase CobS
MLTINTRIPTIARGKIRSLVKAHAGWRTFIEGKGKVSAQALNSEILEFALTDPGLVTAIEAILSASPANAATDAPETMDENDMADMENDDMANAPSLTGFALNDILSSVDQFLSPLVRSELSNVLGPVLAAANKPAVEIERVIEVERIVEVAPGEAPRVSAPKARRDKRVTFRTLYPSRSTKCSAYFDAPLTLWTGAANSPAADPFYVVDKQHMALLMTGMERSTNIWLTGPAGTGKSTLPEQAAATLGRPFVKIGMTRQTEVEALIGGMALRNGATVWEDGALIKAMRQPGTVILIDELTFAPAGVQAIIQLVADDHRSITLPTGELVKAADGVVFVVADNTAGSGDEGGLYAGTNVSNAALVTRFKRMIHVDYLSAQKEAEALANHTKCPMEAARHLADFVAQVRRMPAMQGVVISLRQMVGFVQCVQDGFSSKDAFVATISSRMPATERATIDGLCDLRWNENFEALVHGKAAPVIAPSDSPAATAFGDTSF